MGDAGRRIVRERFSVEPVVAHYRDLFRSLGVPLDDVGGG